MTDELDLVEQIRAIRRRLWQEHGPDAERFFEWIRAREAKHPEKLATPPRDLTDEEIDEIVRMTGG
ncbi:MAG: hypothetical protein HY905_14000 [Deltaproteobacteria bacterium]|nr:hypothetical protein [Deltaproteobacteria bacterium]